MKSGGGMISLPFKEAKWLFFLSTMLWRSSKGTNPWAAYEKQALVLDANLSALHITSSVMPRFCLLHALYETYQDTCFLVKHYTTVITAIIGITKARGHLVEDIYTIQGVSASKLVFWMGWENERQMLVSISMWKVYKQLNQLSHT